MTDGPDDAKRARGASAYHAGRSAEQIVEAQYAARGIAVVERRWRGRGGEIDLVLRDGDAVVFVEVKAARSFDAAAGRISARQRGRLLASAAEYLDGEPGGALTETRFDVALVDRTGRVEIVENAFM